MVNHKWAETVKTRGKYLAEIHDWVETRLGWQIDFERFHYGPPEFAHIFH